MNVQKFLGNNKNYLLMATALILVSIICRLLPHPANFTPIGAIALFGGFYFNKGWKMLIPMMAMFISDSIIGFYSIGIMLAVYACILINSVLGSLIAKNKVMAGALGLSLLGSIIFFLGTNFAVWAFGGWYAHSWAGLQQCFLMALPFFRNTVLGDLTYSFALFGAYALAVNLARAKRFSTVNN
jgi:hypothetical protein